jgi:hypothetical protein
MTRGCAALVASGVINALVWVLVPWILAGHRAQVGETLVVSVSPVRIEHRAAARHGRRAAAAPAGPATPSLQPPTGWAKQNIGNEGMLAAALWLDWTKQTAEFVPRVFLWQRQVTTPDGRAPSLQEAVADVLATISDEGDRLYASRPQAVCSGTRPGWFLSYDKPDEDPPIHVDDTLYMAGDMVFRATYVRPMNQPEDSRARDALNTLCKA